MKRIDEGIICPWCQEKSTLEEAKLYEYADVMFDAKCPHCGRKFFLQITAEGLYWTENKTPESVLHWERLADMIKNAPVYGAAFTEKYMSVMKEGGMLNGI